MPLDDLKEFIKKTIDGPDWLRGSVLAGYPYRQDLYKWLDHGKMHPRLRQAIRGLTLEQISELRQWKRDRIGPKLAKWIYRNLTADQWEIDYQTNSSLLWEIALSQRPVPWKHGFFWNEVYRLKSYEFGMWVIEAMSSLVTKYDDSPKFIDLYHDESAHPMVRGEAIFGLTYSAHRYGGNLPI